MIGKIVYFGLGVFILILIIFVSINLGSSEVYKTEASLDEANSILSYAIQEKPIAECTYNTIEYDYNSTLENSQKALDYINLIRRSYGRNAISFDKRAYLMALARAKDMRDNNYIDHINLDGYCVGNIKRVYGFDYSEYVAENIYGRPDYVEGECTKVEVKPIREVIDIWMKSRGHRYNILYEGHTGGAVGCYKNICVFIGVNRDGFGSECTSAKEGEKFWSNAPLVDGEIQQ